MTSPEINCVNLFQDGTEHKKKPSKFEGFFIAIRLGGSQSRKECI